MKLRSTPADARHGDNPAIDLDELLMQQQLADHWDNRVRESIAHSPPPDLRNYLTEDECVEYHELEEQFDLPELTADVVMGRTSELLCLASYRHLAEVIQSDRARLQSLPPFAKAASTA